MFHFRQCKDYLSDFFNLPSCHHLHPQLFPYFLFLLNLLLLLLPPPPDLDPILDAAIEPLMQTVSVDAKMEVVRADANAGSSTSPEREVRGERK